MLTPHDRVENEPSAVSVTAYGEHPDQELTVHRAADPRGVVVLLHGGYWRARHNASLMAPLAHELVRAGWLVVNVEYRRVGTGGGWPTTLEDVSAAIAAATEFADSGSAGNGDTLPIIGMGHSAGGQLALLAATNLDAIVALAPVTDLTRTFNEGLGEGAAGEFMGAGPDTLATAYADASPIDQLPVGRPVLIVHGSNDERVPIAHTRDYIAAAAAAGDHVRLIEPEHLPHLDVIDPHAEHWSRVRTWMRSIVPTGRTETQ